MVAKSACFGIMRLGAGTQDHSAHIRGQASLQTAVAAALSRVETGGLLELAGCQPSQENTSPGSRLA